MIRTQGRITPNLSRAADILGASRPGFAEGIERTCPSASLLETPALRCMMIILQ
jgi:hypothetical protein